MSEERTTAVVQLYLDELAGDSPSEPLVRAMLEDGLVDALHLFVFPLTLGAGKRLFANGGPGARFTLAGTEAYESGVVHLSYQPAH